MCHLICVMCVKKLKGQPYISVLICAYNSKAYRTRGYPYTLTRSMTRPSVFLASHMARRIASTCRLCATCYTYVFSYCT